VLICIKNTSDVNIFYSLHNYCIKTTKDNVSTIYITTIIRIFSLRFFYHRFIFHSQYCWAHILLFTYIPYVICWNNFTLSFILDTFKPALSNFNRSLWNLALVCRKNKLFSVIVETIILLGGAWIIQSSDSIFTPSQGYLKVMITAPVLSSLNRKKQSDTAFSSDPIQSQSLVPICLELLSCRRHTFVWSNTTTTKPTTTATPIISAISINSTILRLEYQCVRTKYFF